MNAVLIRRREAGGRLVRRRVRVNYSPAAGWLPAHGRNNRSNRSRNSEGAPARAPELRPSAGDSVLFSRLALHRRPLHGGYERLHTGHSAPPERVGRRRLSADDGESLLGFWARSLASIRLAVLRADPTRNAGDR